MRQLCFVPLLLASLAAASCANSGAAGAGGDVAVTLKDFAITAEPGTFGPGAITFDVTNEGPSAHEFVIFRTDDAPEAIPVENGVIPEDQIDMVDEVENIAPSVTASLTVTLDAGSYVLVCNLPSHYAAGMHTGFTVG